MGVLFDIALWLKARPIAREVVINGPGHLQSHIWKVDGEPGVAVIEKKAGGCFLGFRIEDKPFGRAVGDIKRRRTMFERKHGGNHGFPD